MQEAFQGVNARLQRARFNAGDGRLRRPGHLCELPLAEPGTAAGVAKQKSSATHASMIAKILSRPSGRRGGIPAIAIQVKTARDVDRYGLVEARASFPAGHVREHPAFLYTVLLLDSVAIGTAWLVPSPDFNRLAYRQAARGRVVLAFRGDPTRPDRYTPFLVPPLELGPRLLSVIDALEEPIPHQLLGSGLGLMVGHRRPGNKR